MSVVPEELMSSKRATCCAVLFAAICAHAAERPAATAANQNFPAKPIRLIVPQAPGGANDLLARSVANYLTERLGWPVLVDNRAGADGIIGTEIVARSAPDGYTLLMVLAVAKAKPGQIIMASGGGFQHFGSALFKSLSGLDFININRKE